MAKSRVKITTRKYMGDDKYSWAVFIEGYSSPAFAGLTRSELPYYRRLAREIAERRA